MEEKSGNNCTIEQKVSSPDQEITSAEPSTNNSNNHEPFKKPNLLIGPQRGKSIRTGNIYRKTVNEIKNQSRPEENVDSYPGEGRLEVSIKKNVGLQKTSDSKPPPPLQYDEPEWGGLPTQEYKLEVGES